MITILRGDVGKKGEWVLVKFQGKRKSVVAKGGYRECRKKGKELRWNGRK